MNFEKEKIVIVDFGGQYSQLIARRVREAGVYSEVVSWRNALEKIEGKGYHGIIFTGGPNSVYLDEAPKVDPKLFALGIPVLGICYGMQLMAHTLGGRVARADKQEYGKVEVHLPEAIDAGLIAKGTAMEPEQGCCGGGCGGCDWTVQEAANALFGGIQFPAQAWMSHFDYVTDVPDGFEVIAFTDRCPAAAMVNPLLGLYGVQFHAEVEHTVFGRQMINNFLKRVCGLSGNWNMKAFSEEEIEAIRAQVGDGKAICGLSGGVDSSVAAVMVHKAIGDRLTCIFVDHGLLRQNESEEVEALFKGEFHMNFVRIDAKERFLSKLAGVSDPERKRKIIGEEFIRVFEEAARSMVSDGADFLVQGTIYPDVIESGTDTAHVIKSHHNVGGLPEDMKFKLVEPLRNLFKDEVRDAGRVLGLPEHVVARQPFPGPGLAIRVMGEVTEEKLAKVRAADAILRAEIAAAGLDREVWQYFCVLPGVKSVGVMGDERTYCDAMGIRAVTSVDGMTSDWARLPYEVLDKVATRIVSEVPGVNRILYDITSKPPGTIEWE